MGDHHHGHAVGGQLLHDVQHLAHHFRIQGGGGLVEQHYLGIHGQSPDNGDPLLLTAGKLVGIGIGLFLQTYPLQQLHGFLVGLRLGHQARAHGSQGDVFQNGHVGEQVKVLEHHAHLPAHLVDVRLGAGDLHPVEGDGAGTRLFQQVQAAKEGGLAGAGGADDDHLVSGIDVLGDIVQHQMIAEGFAQVFNVYHFDAASFPECSAAS